MALRKAMGVIAHEVVDDLDVVPEGMRHEGPLHIVERICEIKREALDHAETLVHVVQKRVHRVEETIVLLVV